MVRRRCELTDLKWSIIEPLLPDKPQFAFSDSLYHKRSLVERFFNRIKHFRGTLTRYDK